MCPHHISYDWKRKSCFSSGLQVKCESVRLYTCTPLVVVFLCPQKMFIGTKLFTFKRLWLKSVYKRFVSCLDFYFNLNQINEECSVYNYFHVWYWCLTKTVDHNLSTILVSNGLKVWGRSFRTTSSLRADKFQYELPVLIMSYCDKFKTSPEAVYKYRYVFGNCFAALL